MRGWASAARRSGPDRQALVAAAVLLAAVLPAAVLAGCSGQGPADGKGAAVPPAAAGVLRGLVVDAALRPLAGANVTATGAGATLQASTGADGLFNFTALAPGSYAVAVRKEAYLSAQRLVQVAAGDPRPPLVQVVLQVQAGEQPFVVAIKWEGLIGCAFAYGNLCSAPAQGGFDVVGDQSAHLFWDEYVAQARVPDLVQAEAVWEATLPSSAELRPIFGWSTPPEWVQFQYGGTFASFSTPSPAFYRLPGEEAGVPGLGVTVGLVVEFYGGQPGGLPAGVTANQPIDLFLHDFYGYLPPEAWRFVNDGAPPPP